MNEMRSLQKLGSEYFLYRINNCLMETSLCGHRELVVIGKFLESSQKTDGISSRVHSCKNQTKNFIRRFHKLLEKNRSVLGKFSASCW